MTNSASAIEETLAVRLAVGQKLLLAQQESAAFLFRLSVQAVLKTALYRSSAHSNFMPVAVWLGAIFKIVTISLEIL
jgi:hypothetical protein